MSARRTAIQPDQFATFGQLLRFLRQRAGLTQRELSIAVGYSESQMSRLEQNQRAPDEAALAARFVPALHLESDPSWAARLLELGEASRLAGSTQEAPSGSEAPLAPNNLPVQLTSFIGRAVELAEIRRLLMDGARLLTLTGPGGTGKTRLALQAAAGLLQSFPDGIWWVELAPLADPALVPQTVAAVLGLKEEPGLPMLATLTEHLRRKRVLLILDNCEHLIEGCAQLAEVVLRAGAHVGVLATSRELLGVAGERAFAVPSLRTPEPNAALPVEKLRQYEAVRLFLDRAEATAPQFALSPANAGAVAQVCRRLDGIPLALELAAARLRMLPVEQLAERLSDAFRLLTGGSRTALPRHQTLQALIDWSYGLLPAAEKRLLCRLAVFADGWSLEAAEAVVADGEIESRTVAELLGRLIDKSLVVVAQQAGSARYRLMETVRQYAEAKLAASGEAGEVQRRHTRYFAAFTAVPDLTYHRWLDLIAPERDNLRTALGRCLVTPGQTEESVQLAHAVGWLWNDRGYSGLQNEARGWFETILARPDIKDHPASMALASYNLGYLLSVQVNMQAGEAHIEQSYQLYQGLGDRRRSAEMLEWLGWAARERGDASMSRVRLQASLSEFQALGTELMILNTTMTLAETELLDGSIGRAKALLEAMLPQARSLGDFNAVGWVLNHLGHAAQLEGDYENAAHLHEASLKEFAHVGPRVTGYVWAHQSLGETTLAQGDARAALAHFTEALDVARDMGDREAIAWCLAGLAGAAALDEEPERGAWLWGAGEKLRLSLGVREAPCSHDTHERLKVQARQQIGEAAFNAEGAAGEAAALSEAIERALS